MTPRFYKFWIVAGLIGNGWIIALILWFTPWWAWLVSVPALLAIEFGCYAWRDREHIQQEQFSEVIRDMVRERRPTGPSQKRSG